MSNAAKIKELKTRERNLLNELSALRGEIVRLAEEDCPIKVGDVVLYKRDGKEYRVTKIDNPEWLWVIGVSRKKDGKWGKFDRRLFGDITPVTSG